MLEQTFASTFPDAIIGRMPDGFIPVSQRAPYTTAQIRLLFGCSDGMGNIIPLHECTVARWRKKGKIPFITLNCRNYRYPRAVIDSMLRNQDLMDEEFAMA